MEFVSLIDYIALHKSAPFIDGEHKWARQGNTHQYRALPGVRGKGMASRTLARPVT